MGGSECAGIVKFLYDGVSFLLLLLSALVYLREDFPLTHFTGSLGLRGTGGVGVAVEMGRGCWW